MILDLQMQEVPADLPALSQLFAPQSKVPKVEQQKIKPLK